MDKGIFELKTAEDLFRKLENDFEIVKNDPTNSHAWFNFFVTAEHLPEWHLHSRNLAKKFRDKYPLLRVCSQLASGAKHFNSNQYQGILSTNETYLICTNSDGTTSFVDSPPRHRREFVIILNDSEAMDLGKERRVIDLAEQILDFYREDHSEVFNQLRKECASK